jgi:Tol biopolymer transport system component
MRTFKLVAILFLVLVWMEGTRAVAFQSAQPAQSIIEVQTPPTKNPRLFEISPDGDKILLAGEADGKRQIWIHSLSSRMSRPLPGTDDSASSPCWAPDSRSFAFFTPGHLNRFELETNSIRPLTNHGALQLGLGCTWNRDGVILYALAASRPILRISETGGNPQPATPPDPVYYQLPQFLPDGRHFLVYANGNAYVAELGGAAPRWLFASGSAAVYSPNGYLLFQRGGILYAQKFDTTEFVLSGEPFVVARGVLGGFKPGVSISAAGDIVYRTGSGVGFRSLKWFDRTGRELGTVGRLVVLGAGAPVLSPDERTLALNTVTGILLLDLATGKMTPFTSGGFPVWSTDGKTIYYASNQSGQSEMYRKSSSGEGDAELVLRNALLRLPMDASVDGHFLLFRSGRGIMWVQLDGNPPGEGALSGTGSYPRFSPDGFWVVDQVEMAGRFEIVLQKFPSGPRVAVTTKGGFHPVWRRDGKELFFVAPDGKLMAVPIDDLGPDGHPKVGTPVALFTPSLIPNLATSGYGQQYVVSKDGQRFLIATPAPETVSPLKLIRKWQPDLSK